MDPISALLLAVWIAGYFTRNVYQDSVYKATGKLPPSYLREVERRQRRGEADGPGRRFWRNAWEDAVAEADARRTRRFEKRRQRLEDRWDHEDAVEDAEKQAWEDNRARDRAEDEAYEQNQRRAPDPTADTPEPQPRQQDPTPAEEATVIPWPRPTAVPDPVPPDNTQGETVSVPTGEATGLTSAILYAADMAGTSQQGVSSTELFIANLTAAGVSGDAITHFRQAMEFLSQAAAAFEAGKAELEADVSVRDAYSARQNAGEKQFVLND